MCILKHVIVCPCAEAVETGIQLEVIVSETFTDDLNNTQSPKYKEYVAAFRIAVRR